MALGGTTAGALPEAGAVRSVALIANVASGRVGPGAPDEASEILAEFGLKATIETPAPGDLEAGLKRLVDAKPDLLVVLAGDGTARAAAQLCGPDGPLLAPLAGGTMNMLPHALYGPRTWQAALRDILTDGVARDVSGGEVEGQAFFCAAIFGSPALWADAREAARSGKLVETYARARRALRYSFAGRLRLSLDAGPPQHAAAVGFICPLVSKALPDAAPALEAAAMDLASARDVFSLAFHAVADDWRHDPGVHDQRCREALIQARGRIPAILDGEPVRLTRRARIRFRPLAFRALVPAAKA